MALEPLASAVEKILQSEDYVIEHQKGYLLARKGETSIAICIPPPTEDLLQALADFETAKLDDFQYKVLVSKSAPDEETVHIAEAKGIVIWTKENIEEERGVAILRKYIKDPPSSLVKRITENEVKPVGFDLGLAPRGAEINANVKELYLPVNIDLRHVRELADKNINGFSFNLELVPYYVFSSKYKSIKTHLAVNGIDRTVEEWEEPLIFKNESSEHHTKLEPQIDPDDAREQAMKKSLHRFSKRVETMEKKGHMTIVQKEDLLPLESDVCLENLGLVYRPLWCVEGVHGVMVLDAFTRKIIEMDYYRDAVA